MYHYKAKILDWLDGDSARLLVDLGMSIYVKQTVRVKGINTPEVTGHERPLGCKSLNRALELAPVGSFVEVTTEKLDGGGDKFGRLLASIKLNDNRDYATVMLEEGLAKAWSGQGSKPV